MTTLERAAENGCWGVPARSVGGRRWMVALGVVALVGASFGLRLYKAGQWSFWGDELVTYYDSAMLLESSYWNPRGYDPPHERFIHACPLGFWMLGLWHAVVPRSELTARLPLVVFSAFGVVAAVLCIWRTRGPWAGGALAALLVAWPWGLFHAQNNRPYSIALFFSIVGFLLADGGFAVRRSRSLALAAVFFVLAALSHSGCVLMLAVLLGWQVRCLTLDRRYRTRGHLLAAVVPLAGLALIGVLIRRFSGGFVQTAWWYMSPERCLASLVNNVTLPITLAALGAGVWVVATRQRDLYWALACSAAVVTACIVGPVVMSFRSDYVFAMTLPIHLLAAVAIGRIARTAWETHWSLGLAALGAVPALIAPSIASHYIDGDRPDYRGATAVVRSRGRPGDVVWARHCLNVRYYLTDLPVEPYSADPVAAVDDLLLEGRRVWCLLDYSTGGIPERRLSWLGRRFRPVADVGALRFDYHQNGVAVFLAEGESGPALVKGWTPTQH